MGTEDISSKKTGFVNIFEFSNDNLEVRNNASEARNPAQPTTAESYSPAPDSETLYAAS